MFKLVEYNKTKRSIVETNAWMGLQRGQFCYFQFWALLAMFNLLAIIAIRQTLATNVLISMSCTLCNITSPSATRQAIMKCISGFKILRSSTCHWTLLLSFWMASAVVQRCCHQQTQGRHAAQRWTSHQQDQRLGWSEILGCFEPVIHVKRKARLQALHTIQTVGKCWSVQNILILKLA